MFARLGELADLPLSAARQPRQRLVGCCRDFTVLFVAMARHKGIPSRARVGFAGYFFDGWLIDHEIAEVWDGSAERWRLVEPEIDDDHADPVDGASFDALDVPPDRFLTAPRAWQLARSGAVDPERFVVNPDLEIPATRGLPQLRRNLVRDLAALNKTEMLLWEDWGVLDSHTAPGPGELPVLDELATLTGQPSPPLADLRSAYRRPEFVVPDTVTSYSPAGPMSRRSSTSARWPGQPADRCFGQAGAGATRWHRGPRISAASEFGEKLPCLGLPGPTTYSQGTQEKRTEEHDNADDQQIQQALGGDTHDAEHDCDDHQE